MSHVDEGKQIFDKDVPDLRVRGSGVENCTGRREQLKLWLGAAISFCSMISQILCKTQRADTVML